MALATAILATSGLAACTSSQPTTVKAGRLGVVSLAAATTGSQQEGSGAEWAGWLATAANNGFSQPGAIPRNHALSRSEALAGLEALMQRPDGALWIGHATFLIRIGGMTILTDPVFSETVSPLPPLGPKRYRPPGIEIEDIPALDLILLSHHHYDHLDIASLSRLGQRFPDARVLTPDGTESFATDAGLRNVRGARPGSEFRVGTLRLMAVPAYHVASRAGIDAGLTPCLSWSVRRRGGISLLFAGDTAYGPVFKHLRRVLGPHQVALVPIGAYEPRTEVRHVHASPEEAVRIARDVGASLAIGMHWGTFPLSGEPPMQPANRFRRAGGAMARVLRIGESVPFPALGTGSAAGQAVARID